MHRGHAVAELLVVLGGGKDVVRVEPGRRDAVVAGDDHLELRPQVLQKQLLSAPLAAQQVAARLEEHPWLDLFVELGAGGAPPPLLERLLEVLAEAALHGRVVVLRVVPALLVPVLVVPEERGREHHSHSAELARLLRDAVLDHLRGHGRVLGSDEAPHRDHAGDQLLGLLLPGPLLAVHEGAAVAPHDRPGAGTGALLAPVRGETQEQRHRPLHQIPVVVLPRVPADEDLRLSGRHLPRQTADVLGMDPADLTGLLRRVILQVPPQPHEDGLYLHRRDVLQEDRVAALQGRIDARGRERPPRRRRQRPRQRVPPVELVLSLPFHDIGPAQETAVVLAHQQREIGLLLHELLLVQAGVDDHLAHRQRQGGVRADPDRLVVVRVNRRGAVVRGDRHDLAAVVSGLGQEVVPVDVGVDRVRVPDQRQVRQKPVVHARGRVVETPGDVPTRAEVLELRVAVGGRRSQQIGVLAGRSRPDLGRQRGDDRLHALVLDGVEHGVGDLGQRLVPGHRLELSLAPLTDPLEGLGHAVG